MRFGPYRGISCVVRVPLVIDVRACIGIATWAAAELPSHGQGMHQAEVGVQSESDLSVALPFRVVSEPGPHRQPGGNGKGCGSKDRLRVSSAVTPDSFLSHMTSERPAVPTRGVADLESIRPNGFGPTEARIGRNE